MALSRGKSNADLLALVEALTLGPDPTNQDECGGCVFCGGTPPRETYGYAEAYRSDHDTDCPWLRGRLALGDEIPEHR